MAGCASKSYMRHLQPISKAHLSMCLFFYLKGYEMFFCDPCANKRKWPTSLYKSLGMCEVCKVQEVCSDVPSKYLPMPMPVAAPVETYVGRHRKGL